MRVIKTLAEAKEFIEQLKADNAQAIATIDKLNMLNNRVGDEIRKHGALTVERYNVLYAQVIAEWRAKQARGGQN